MKMKFTILSTLLLAFSVASTATATASEAATASAIESVSQQQKVIKGIITDSDGNPMIGATVIAPSGNGTITGADGSFETKVSGSDEFITVSYLGMKDERVDITSAQSSYKVIMEEDVTRIDEVVVVGYGKEKKATVAGAVVQVAGDDMKAGHTANLSNSIAGRLPGVIANTRSGQPGSDGATIYIRGISTFGDSSPLYVIDGVANRGGIDHLNPSDIESVSVLKDASAAIYGAQAGNGVILVTTKRGNTQVSKPVITYEGSFSLQEPTRTPDFLNAYEYMTYDDEAQVGAGGSEKWTGIKDGYLDGSIDPNQYADTDWYNAVIAKVAPQTQHSLSIRGGKENVNYYVSAGYMSQKYGFVDTNNNFNTLQTRANVDAKITKDLTLGFEFALREENHNDPYYDMGTIYWELYHAYPYIVDKYDNGLPGYGISAGKNPAIMVTDAPGYNDTKDHKVENKVNFELKMPWVTQGLSISGYAAYDLDFYNKKTLMDQWDAYYYDSASGEYINGYATTGAGYIGLTQSTSNSSRLSLHGRIAYEREFGKSKINAFAAYEQSQYEYDGFWASRRDFISSDLPYLFAGGDDLKGNSGSASHSARQNIFGRVNYTYDNKYIIEATLRYDGSQNFAADKRWGLFPAVSGAWRMTQESFMQDNKTFDELKVRASWGKMGNDRVDAFQYLSTFAFGNGVAFGTTPSYVNGLVPDVVANPDITWEVVSSSNIGVDATLWNGKLSFSAQYFYSYRSNILTTLSSSIPSYTGLTLPDQNVGEISNQGIEIEVGHRSRVGEVDLFANGNFAFARSKIIYFDEAEATPEWQRRTGNTFNTSLVYVSDGIYQTQDEIDNSVHLSNAQPGDIKYVDIDGDGVITSNDRQRFNKNATPEITFGLTMGAAWRNWDINMLWQGQARAWQMERPYSFNFDRTYYDNRWISAEETPDSEYPRATIFRMDMGSDNNTYYSDFWYKDASFLRLKSLEVGYNIPKRLLGDSGVGSARVYVGGSNIFTLSAIKTQDPESTNWYSMVYPQQRVWTIGVKVSF